MTTPTIPQRRLLAAGAKRSAQSWSSTGQSMGATFGMLIESDGGLTRSQSYLPAREADTPFVLEGDLGPIDPVDFSPEFTMRYDLGALGVLIAQLFGTAGGPVDIGLTARRHTFQWAEENSGEFATVCIERPSKILEVPSVKPHMLDLTIADGFLKGVIGLRGNTIHTDSVENTYVHIDALTYKDRGNRMKFSGLVVDMNDESGQDAEDEADLEVSDVSIHYERPMDSLHKAGSNFIIEPMQNAPSIITVTMTFPRMNAINAAYFDDFIAETEKKIRMVVTGNLITGTAHYRYLRLFFPRMRVINVDYPFDDIVPASITLQAEQAASAPLGMGYTVPYWVFVNETTPDYLA